MPRFLTVLCLSLLSACGGGGSPKELADEGSALMSKGDYAGAAAKYEKALDALGTDTATPDWKRSKMGWIQAQTQLDAGRAKDEFLRFAAASPGTVTDTDFNIVAGKLSDAKHRKEAIEVLTVGIGTHTESPHLQKLRDQIAKQAETEGDSGSLDALKGLGYIGGDEE